MESDKPDLNSILENARAHLDMYGKSSQDDLTDPTKEILLTRPKDQEVEDVSGLLFDKAKESAGIECLKSDSGKSLKSQNQNPDDLQEAKVLGINAEVKADIEDVEGEESSNKNFDSSTMTLGDQQSFQNQVELTTQTTYTNMDELTEPAKDDILVVTGPIPEPSDTASAPSHVSQSETEGLSSETTQVTLENIDPEIMVTEDDELQHNQMAGTNIYFRGWKSDPCRGAQQENVDQEELSQLNQRDDVEKGDADLKAGAGTREGSPVKTSTKLMLQVAERLSQLELHEGKQCPWLKQGVCEKGVDCVCERNVNDKLNNDSSICVSYLDVKDDEESKSENTRSCDVALTIQSYQINNIDNRQIEFVQYFEANEVDKSEGNVRKVSEKSIFEDEGFVDSKELMDSAKVIFISNQEDKQSCKPFETEDDTSCLLEPSSAGRSLDLQSDLEAKPSLTDVHQVQKHQIIADDIIDSEKALSTEGLNSNEKDGDNYNSEEQLFQNNPNQEVENAPSQVPKVTMLVQQNNSPAGPKKSLPTLNKYEKKPQMDTSQNKSQSTSHQDQKETAKSIIKKTSYNQTESSKAVESDLKQASTSQPLNETITSIPNIMDLITKSHDTTKEGPKGKPMCIGRAIFEAFIKNMSKTNSNSPELCKLKAILERASQSTDPSPDVPKRIIMSNKSSSGTDFESANECSTEISSYISKGCDDSSSSGSETETDSEPLNPLDIIEKLANDPITIPFIPSTLSLHQQVNSDGCSSGIPLILNPETFIDLKLHQSVPVESLNHVPNIDLIDDPQMPHISATDLDSINTFDPLSSSKDVLYSNDTEETISSKMAEESRTVRSNDEFNRLPSPPSSDILDSNIENISSDIVTPIIEKVFSSNSEESVPIINPLISVNSLTENNESPKISDLIFKSIRVPISEQLKAEPMPHSTTDLNVQTNDLENGKTTDISEKSPEVEENVALSKSNSPSKSDHPLTPFVSEIQSPGSSHGPNIINYITDPPLPNIKPPSPNRLDLQIFSPEDVQSDAEEEVDSAKAPPRPPPRPRAAVQTKKMKLNFFKKLFGIKTKN